MEICLGVKIKPLGKGYKNEKNCFVHCWGGAKGYKSERASERKDLGKGAWEVPSFFLIMRAGGAWLTSKMNVLKGPAHEKFWGESLIRGLVTTLWLEFVEQQNFEI